MHDQPVEFRIRWLASLAVVALLTAAGCSEAPGASSSLSRATPTNTPERTSSTPPAASPASGPNPSPTSSPSGAFEAADSLATFADQDAERYVRIDLAAAETTPGLMFADLDDGLFWPNGALTTDVGTDRSISISYRGPGKHSPDAEFDPLTWFFVIGPVEEVEVDISGTLSADLSAANITLRAGPTAYVLEDDMAAPGVETVIAAVVEELEAEDWSAIYARLHSLTRAGMTEAQFVDAMTQATAQQGTVASVELVGDLSVGPSSSGWDLASNETRVTMLRDGCETAFTSTLELVSDGGWKIGNLGELKPDLDAPTSCASPGPS